MTTQSVINNQFHSGILGDDNVANELSVRARIGHRARCKYSFRLISDVHVNCKHAHIVCSSNFVLNSFEHFADKILQP